MSEVVKQSTNVNSGVDKVDWLVDLNYSSSFISNSKVEWLFPTCIGTSTGGMWSAQEMKNHINVLELLAIKLTIKTSWKTLKHKAIHLQVDNQNLKLVQLAIEIWDHLLQCGITLTAEYLPSKLNVTADWESRNNSGSSE